MINLNLSFYKSAKDNKGTIKAFAQITPYFSNADMLKQTEAYRAMQPGKEKDLLKTTFPAVTWSGTFALATVIKDTKTDNNTRDFLDGKITWKEIGEQNKYFQRTRHASQLQEHSGHIVMDIDDITQEQHDTLKKVLQHDPYLAIAFTSPNRGLKLIYKTSNDATLHLSYFLAIKSYIKTNYGIDIDDSGKDVSRLCFICYDRGAILRNDVTPFPLDRYRVAEPEPKQKPLTKKEHKEFTAAGGEDLQKQFAFIIRWVERNETYDAGQTNNNYLYLLSRGANRLGISQTDTENYISSNFPEGNEKSITDSINSAYKNHSYEHGQFKETADRINANSNKQTNKANNKSANTTTPHGTTSTQKVPGQTTESGLPGTGNIIDGNQQPGNPNNRNPQQHNTPGANEEYHYTDDDEFWITSLNDKTGKESLSLVYGKFFNFMEKKGFCNLGGELQDNLELIRIQKGIVRPTIINKTRNDVKVFINNFCKRNQLYSVHEMLHRGEDKYFSRSKFSNLKTEHLKFLRDTADSSYYFHSNCMVEVTKHGIYTRPYDSGEKFLWRSQIIDKPFTKIDLQFGMDKDGRYLPKEAPCEWAAFQMLVSTNPNKAKDMDAKDVNFRFYAHATSFGHLINDYKGPTCKGIIGVDHKKAHDRSEQNGGTGKGRFAEALGFVKRTYEVDGQNFDPKNKSVFEQVTMDTKIITVVDCGPNFDFRYFFNMLTSKFTFHKMYVGPVTIPFEDSAKFYFDTNFSFKGDGTSFRRRQHVIEFDDFFNEEYTPLDYFGHPLFRAWDADEWNRYYNYCYWCDMMYKQMGLVDYPAGNYGDRKLANEVPPEFIDWLDAVELNPSGNPTLKNNKPIHIIKRSGTDIGIGKYKKLDLYATWKKLSEDWGMTKPSAKQFTGWMQKYCAVRDLQYITDKKGGVEYAWISDGTIEPDKLKLMGELQFSVS